MAKRTRYYAVVSGKPTGIFNTWEGGAAQATQGIPGADHASFATLELALEWYRQRVPDGARYASPVIHFETSDIVPEAPHQALQTSLDGMASGQHVVFTICHPETNEPFYVGETIDLERREAHYLGSVSRKRKGVCVKIAELLAQGITPVFQVVERVDSKEAALDAKSRLYKLYVQRGLTLYNRTLEHREIHQLYHVPAVPLTAPIGDGPVYLGPHLQPSREHLKRRVKDHLSLKAPGLVSNSQAKEYLALLWAATHADLEALSFYAEATEEGPRLQANLVSGTSIDFDYANAIDRLP
ncbi:MULTISPECIES: RNase H1/viroplasmin domain-containing protein [Pseudomonas]|uniref:Ribonuclease H n=1 Tax=Pseudomonas monteilii TaxID=76759 RepID=A0A399M928_9PSED|nr:MULTISPECIES: RNase H1/viroplasmin domain-containing protein [Pseudomonas]MCO7055676.1 RNase H1/viroplasmin domain-containing protein [Pseudomonas juntendi]RII77346.1 ribonuclease H [Pseudomonas monteilii]UJM14971.1 RNase H1/viroplasmin domain-containing protein [Pseudomonas juntendi]UXA41150.1 RNase H1/viroplasmin domain-containing protein [Pseudomonas juntendi]